MIFICGPLCSGKTTYGKILATGLGVPFIEVSSIVKELTHLAKREDLQQTKFLDAAIIEKLKNSDPQSVVVGVRQKSILEAFSNSRCIWIETPFEERLDLFLKRADKKDTLTKQAFIQFNGDDDQLGLDAAIIEKLKNSDPQSVVVGVRQKSILEAFSGSRYIWIETPFEERLDLFLKRADKKDTLTKQAFIQFNGDDDQLGLDEVRNYIFSHKDY